MPGVATFVDRRGRVATAAAAHALATSTTSSRTPFPDVTLPSLMSDDTVRLRDFRGRVVVVNMWASWCGPCRLEMPGLDRLARELNTAHVAVLGLNADVQVELARRFVAELDIGYRNAHGGPVLAQLIGYRGLPYTVVLDREHRVSQAIYGFGGSVEPIRRAVLKALEP
ncbi:MAG: TlpA family protein disulfide reductase [Gemmatimonadaceae bacterium]